LEIFNSSSPDRIALQRGREAICRTFIITRAPDRRQANINKIAGWATKHEGTVAPVIAKNSGKDHSFPRNAVAL